MAETRVPAARPLSPHLQIYRLTLTLVMSDSLKATVIVIVLVLTISANAELELVELELELPRLPAVPDPPVEFEEELPELLDADEVDPADTEAPGATL